MFKDFTEEMEGVIAEGKAIDKEFGGIYKSDADLKAYPDFKWFFVIYCEGLASWEIPMEKIWELGTKNIPIWFREEGKYGGYEYYMHGSEKQVLNSLKRTVKSKNRHLEKLKLKRKTQVAKRKATIENKATKVS